MDTMSLLISSMFVLILIGVPIYMVLISSTLISLFAFSTLPLSVVHNSLFEGLNSFPLLAIPCFVVAGTIMEKSGVTGQIIDVVKILVGRMSGGLGITTILACTFFAAISGSGPGTVAAIGTLLIPSMLRQGYSPKYAASVASSGGTIGILIPPSNPLIIYGIIGNVSITGLFTAGFIPGFMIAFILIFVAWLLAKKENIQFDENIPAFKLSSFAKICLKNIFSLLTPFIILGSIYSGICTPVESSVVAVVWSLFVGGFILKGLSLRKIYDSVLDGVVLCGVVLIIVGASTLFGKILTIEQAPLRLAEALLNFSQNKYVILLLILSMLFVLGMFLETLATLIIVVPVLLPVVTSLGVDPIHFGIILVVSNEIALLTPPLGVNLFVSSKIANISVETASMGVLPYIAVLILCALLVTFIPQISMFLPKLLGYA